LVGIAFVGHWRLCFNRPASVKTAQELLRHASPVMTFGVYAKAITVDKDSAQDAIAAMFVGHAETKSEPAD
jgi:integrase